MNVLLYGPTGTGKTELARLLAREAGARLFVVGTADEQGDDPTAWERLSSLQLANHLVRATRALLLFDECEDLFEWTDAALRNEGRASVRFSKQWFNDLLETNAVPTIWVTNTTSGIDPAFLRRFAYAIEVRALGPRRRAMALARHLGPADAVTAADVDGIAQRFEAPPALLSAAVAHARLASGDGCARTDVVERLLAPMHELTSGRRAPDRTPFDAARFRFDCVNASSPLPEPTGEAFSMCLFGPPGTGKSELARWYAWSLDRPVVERRASDILSMWVGETERNIARAFREAADEGAVLVFDEVDSLLRDRGRADHSWEATQVNELLQQLESFSGVVICTTNHFRDLDEAALRRFVFKVELRPLSPAQAVMLFERELLPLCGAGAEPAAACDAVSVLPRLTPGDFAAVRRRIRALGRSPSPLQLVRELERELQAKRLPKTVRGFA